MKAPLAAVKQIIWSNWPLWMKPKRIRSQSQLIADACREVGLKDFGPPVFMEGFRRLHDSVARQSALHRVGKKLTERMFHDLLCNRLCIEHAKRTDPSITREKIERPIFILGLPRTGSTFLQRLLACDPDSRCLHFSEALMPLPKPGQTMEDLGNLRRAKAQHFIQHIARHAPQIGGLHAMGVDSPEECYFLLRNSFMHTSFHYLGEIRDYLRWVGHEDKSAAYLDYRFQLQALQSQRKGLRWILKAPSHWNALREWRSTFPDARIIQTHRRPEEVLPSILNLVRVANSLYAHEARPSGLNRARMNGMAAKIRNLMEVRVAVPAADQVDVLYEHLTADPIAEVRRIYKSLGMVLTSQAEQSMRDYIAKEAGEKRVRHRYPPVQEESVLREMHEVFARYYELLDFLKKNPGETPALLSFL